MTHPVYTEIGHAIRKQRKFRRITQAQLAAKIGVSRPLVCLIENGRTGIGVHMLIDIARVLNTMPHMLVPIPRVSSRDFIWLQGERRHQQDAAE